MHGVVFYNDPEHLARLVGPWLREAVLADDAMAAVLDEDTQRAVRHRLGAKADTVRFIALAQDEIRTAQAMVTRTRRLVEDLTRHGRRLMLLQQGSTDAGAEDIRTWESAYNLLLAKQPATLLCAWPTDLDERRRAAVDHTHPLLHADRWIRTNLPYFDPAAQLVRHTPKPLSALANPRSTVEFRTSADLGRVRRAVAEHADRAELGQERTDSLLVAVNEAATITLSRVAGGSCRLDVATTPDAIICDVRGPCTFNGLSAMGVEHENLWLVHEFSDRTEIGNDDGEGIIRVTMHITAA
jgi:hypothetical protein